MWRALQIMQPVLTFGADFRLFVLTLDMLQHTHLLLFFFGALFRLIDAQEGQMVNLVMQIWCSGRTTAAQIESCNWLE